MLKKLFKRIFPVFLAIVMIFSMIPFVASADTVTLSVLDGKVSVSGQSSTKTSLGSTYTCQSISLTSTDVVEATARGERSTQYDNTITITNSTSQKATISFDYTASNCASFSEGSASGTYKALIDANASVTIYFQAAKGTLFSAVTAKVTLSNFTYEIPVSSSKVTVDYQSNFGTVTAGGETIASGTVLDVNIDTGVELVATANSGVEFIGWLDKTNNKIMSSLTTYHLFADGDISVEPMFSHADAKAYFLVEGNTIYDDLNAAATAAASTTSKKIVLFNNSTLPAGNYTIPSGVTLLIPFDDANTLYTTTPKSVDEDNTILGFITGTPKYVAPTVYRKLNMASGANITVNGAISLSAKHFNANGAARGGGSPTGPCSYVYMNENSSITVNSGANLYAWGFIYGKGSVTVKNGGKVYENFQIEDFRGGDQTTELADGSYGIFPVAAYYIQNIEVPLTIEAGGIETCYTSIVISKMIQHSNVAFFAQSGAMFNLTSGSVTKYYDGTTDRLHISLNGDMSISPLSLNVGGTSINSANFELPVNSNISIEINEGSNVNIAQDLALLPGTEIKIAKGANAVLANGVNMYAYDSDDWGGYISPRNSKFTPVQYAPGRTYNRTDADLKDALVQIDGTIDASNGFVYVTSGGANVISSGSGKVILKEGSQAETYQVIQAADPTNSTYVKIPLTAPVLKNSDGSVLNAGTNTYTYTEGFWRCETHNDVSDWVIDKEPTYSIEGSKLGNCNHCGGSTTETVPTITVPDIDGDGSLTALDLVKLKKIVLGTETLPENVYTTISDLNDDKKVNILDLIKIKMFLLEMV